MAHESDMEKMINLFLELDSNKDDIVDLGELRKACEEKRLDMKQVNEWLSRYDSNQDGRITLDEFCAGLGLNNREMTVEKKERAVDVISTMPTVDPSIKMLDFTMSIAKQVHVTDKFLQLYKDVSGNPRQMSDLVAKLKQYLDERYGRVWQVVVVSGSYWINYSHAPLLSMQFQHGPYVCHVWRTSVR